jgi:uncharacterized membrane protein
MSLLISGILIWSLIHFIPSLAVNLRSGLVQRFGLVVYKGVFGLVAIASLMLVVNGWKAASSQVVFVPPDWFGHITIILNLFAFILFFAPYMANSFSRFIRHPQLTGVLLWGVGHLCYTGELRSVVLFAGFSIWAIAEIILINRRKGPWTRPAAASLMANFRLVLAGIGFFAIFMYLHSWLFGVGAVPYLSQG